MENGEENDEEKKIKEELVGWKKEIGNKEDRRKKMVGNKKMDWKEIELRIEEGWLLRRKDKRIEEIDVIIIVKEMKERRNKIKKNESINGWERKIDEKLRSMMIEMNEKEVKDIDEKIKVLIRW